MKHKSGPFSALRALIVYLVGRIAGQETPHLKKVCGTFPRATATHERRAQLLYTNKARERETGLSRKGSHQQRRHGMA